MKERDPLIAPGLAYVEFALRKRGLFRLMFGPILAERAKYPELNEAAATAFRYLQVTEAGEGRPRKEEPEAMAAWGLIRAGCLRFSSMASFRKNTSRRWRERIFVTAAAPKWDLAKRDFIELPLTC